jgi:hypothetical protein
MTDPTFRVVNDQRVDSFDFKGSINTINHTSEQLAYFTVTGDVVKFPARNTHVKANGTLVVNWNLRGIDATGPLGIQGENLVIYNNTNRSMLVQEDDVLASVGNRIRVPADGGFYSVASTSSATFIYDRADNHWLMICCDHQDNTPPPP